MTKEDACLRHFLSLPGIPGSWIIIVVPGNRSHRGIRRARQCVRAIFRRKKKEKERRERKRRDDVGALCKGKRWPTGAARVRAFREWASRSIASAGNPPFNFIITKLLMERRRSPSRLGTLLHFPSARENADFRAEPRACVLVIVLRVGFRFIIISSVFCFFFSFLLILLQQLAFSSIKFTSIFIKQ